MRIRVGSYRFNLAASELSITSDPVLNAMKVAVAIETTWAIKTKLRNPTGDAKQFYRYLREFEAACSVNGRDVVLEHTDGTPSYHMLLNSQAIGGVRCTKFPSFPTGARGEAINYRSIEVEYRATQPLGSSQYMAFNEQITIRGGGARFGCREVNIGPGVRQQLRTATTCFATQSGSATGYLQYPSPPPAIWPFALTDEYGDLTLNSPSTIGQSFNAMQQDYTISWSYSFAFPTRLSGVPHFLTGS